jgi:Bacteriophage tail sheath protein
MPVLTTYPGVYIEEIPSGVHTITGVATSIAAFIGWAPKGATDRAVLILSFADYDREFAGLDARSLLGYAVFHFFLNGGQRCYVIRLAASNAATATLTSGSLFVKAKSPGDWANDYSIRIKARPAPDSARFGLAVVFKAGTPQEVVAESFENLSMSSSDSRFVGSVVTEASAIVNASVTGATQPADGDTPLTGGALGDVLAPNDGADFEAALVPGNGGGIDLLDHVDLFNILCIPGETNKDALPAIEKYCRDQRAMLLVDCPVDATLTSLQNGPPTTLTGADGINAAFYFPWLKAADPLLGNRPRTFPPCGFIAGIYARIDATRGVWKAPAGTEASVTGASAVAVPLTDDQNGVLNPQAINCIRNFPVFGIVSWGARTLNGNDQQTSEWKYIPVRRLALFLEESLYRGTQFAVFEPNDEPLWSQIRLNVGAFMQDLFRQGAFQGDTPQKAYFVKCDSETTTQSDIDHGIVNILVGFAPLKPAEFVIIKIQQIAGQLGT